MSYTKKSKNYWRAKKREQRMSKKGVQEVGNVQEMSKKVIIQDVTPAINSEAPRTRAEALKVLPIERVEAIDRVLEGRARLDLFDDQDERWWRAIDYHKWNEARVNNIVGPFTKYVLRDKVHSKRTVLSKKT